MDSLKIEGCYQLKLDGDNEFITAAIFNPNGVNMAIGTSAGNVYLGVIKDDNSGKPTKVMFEKVENLNNNGSAVTSL